MNWGGGNCDTTQGASLLAATEVRLKGGFYLG